MNEAIRMKRPGHGWHCSICGALVTRRCDAEVHCPDKKVT